MTAEQVVSRSPDADGDAWMLALEDGTSAEPASFVTAVPNWREDEEILTGRGARFRIVAIDGEPIGDFVGLLVVEPVD